MVETGGTYERVQREGIRQATHVDLLAIVLAREPRDVESCVPDATRLTERFRGARLLDLGMSDLQQNTGLEPFEALQRLAAMELGRRSQAFGRGDAVPLENPQAVYEHFKHLSSYKQEHFCAAYLDSKNKPLHTSTVHIGTVNMSVVGAREVFRDAIRENAAALVVAHNHPSGDPSPSPEDIAVTRRLAEVGKLLDIRLLDHLIIGDGRWVSLQQEGVF